MSFQLPDLPYDYGALDPYLSAWTLEFHHGKHHATHVNTLNQLTEGTALANQALETVIKVTSEDRGKINIFNNAAQTWNHTFFWNSMTPGGGGQPPGSLKDKIVTDFGSFEQFKDAFKTAGTTHFGSGYVWLVLDQDTLKVIKTGNAANPITQGLVPLLTADLWEHAYYLDYHNRRPDYLQAFLDHLLNWEFVAQNYASATKVAETA